MFPLSPVSEPEALIGRKTHARSGLVVGGVVVIRVPARRRMYIVEIEMANCTGRVSVHFLNCSGFLRSVCLQAPHSLQQSLSQSKVESEGQSVASVL